MHTVPCEQCGALFRQKRSGESWAKYCSKVCFNRDRVQHPLKNCAWCGIEFRSQNNGKGETRFCSIGCYGSARKEVTQSKNPPKSWVRFPNCEECGRPFVARVAASVCCKDSECRRKRASRCSSNYIMARYRTDPAFREEILGKVHNRRVAKLGLEGITEPKALRSFLVERDQGTCGICLHPVVDNTGPWAGSIGHVIPLARGGLHQVDNLRLEHYRCNLWKSSRLDEELDWNKAPRPRR